jgi:O-antigen ligase
MNNNATNAMAPARMWTGALAFLFPFLSLVTLFGISLCSFLFVLSALFFYKDARAALARHWIETRWVVLAFLFNFAFAALCFMLRPEMPPADLEKPARMFFAVSALMLVLLTRPPARSLWWGVTGGALAALVLVAWQRFAQHSDRPGGFINPITYGDLAMVLALLSLAAVIDFRHERRRAGCAALGALAGLAASLLTGTRGSWVGLALGALLFARYTPQPAGRRVRVLLLGALVLAASTYFIPATGVRDRVEVGVSDLRQLFAGAGEGTSIGIRFELWKGAVMLIGEHPLFGLSPGRYKAEFMRMVGAGRLDGEVLSMPHLHNDALQAQVTGGVLGFAAWLAMLAAPFMFFRRVLASSAGMDAPQYAPALAGMLVVLAYFGFGLTEVIFWSVKGSLFYALMVFMLVGLCLNAKESIG